MANRIFLALVPALDPNVAIDSDAIAVAASWMFPVLWASVFAVEDIYTRTVRWDTIFEAQGFTEMSYPILVAPTTTVRARATDRCGLFLDIFPQTLDRYYQEWLDLLGGFEAPYVLVETQELCACYDSPEEFEPALGMHVRAFERTQADDLAALINQTYSMRFDPATRRVSFVDDQQGSLPFDLHGYKWMRPVPWKE